MAPIATPLSYQSTNAISWASGETLRNLYTRFAFLFIALGKLISTVSQKETLMKTMHKKIIAISLSAILVPTLFTSAYGHDRHDNAAREIRGMFKGLDLTDNQKENIKALVSSQREEMKSSRGEMKTLRTQLANQIKEDKWDEAQVISLVAQMQEFRLSKLEQRVKTKAQVWLLLTPEQQQMMTDKQQARLDKVGDKAGNRAQKRQQKMIRRLGLTDDQKGVVEPLLSQLNENRGQMADIQMTLKQQELAQYASGNVNVEQLIANITAQHGQMQTLAVESASLHHRIWHLLDENQQQKFNKFIEGKKQKRNKKGRYNS